MNRRKKKDIDIYAACDEAIRMLDRENVEAFGRLKMLEWTQADIIREVTALYRKSRRRAKRRYWDVGFEAYLLALMAMCGVEAKKAHGMAEKAITDEWLEEILTQTDFVTMYRFDREAERKAQRLIEALGAAEDRNREIDKALRYWSQQLGQYAINVTDYAVVQAFQDAGVLMAEWLTQKDGHECSECYALDGQVFHIDEIPRKPHWGCRCKLRPVFRGKKAEAVDENPQET